MRQKLTGSGHSMKMMWGCAALVLLAVVVAFSTSAYVWLLIIPCMAMMGAMVWMVMRGTGGTSR